jgi:tetratricopeptide (TPR) repeat protein
MLLTACGNPRDATNVPDQPSNPDQAPVIVLGRSTSQAERTHEPLNVAAEEPALAVAETPQPANVTDADLPLLVRDPRKITWSPRPRSLLVTEIQTLEALFAATPTNAPDRSKLIRRLADNYVELKNAAMRDKQHLLQVPGSSSGEYAKLDKLATAARAAAVKYYQMLEQSYPTFCVSPNPTDPAQGHGCLDETHYFLGLELVQADALDAARKQFFLLVRDFPQSKWVPHAYLAFGEFFLAEAATDPTKLEFARQSYEKVIQYPPPQNETYGFAHYRLAKVFVQKQDLAVALSHMIKASEFARNFAPLPIAQPLAVAVRRDVVPIYATAGVARKAEVFFRRFTNDPPASTAQLAPMIDALVRIYVRENKRAEATEVCISFTGAANTLPACQQMAGP